MTTERFDALVIGGGPAGATAALLLARAGWSVALVEQKSFPRRKVCGEYLSATNLPLFEQLKIADIFREHAGPEVCQVGLFAGDAMLQAKLPRLAGHPVGWGRAITRDKLDTLILEQAKAAGAHVLQPWSARELLDEGDNILLRADSRVDGTKAELRATLGLVAHGSWNRGSLASQSHRHPPRPSDLFAFKAHFRESELPAGLMPLLAFPGGYGGMVHCGEGRVSLSCCIRRDRLLSLPKGNRSAGEAVLQLIQEQCRGVRRALRSAQRDGDWLAAGPIRPGIRLQLAPRLFPLGNVAGEAHPVVAEGISMAMQSAWLLAQRLIAWRNQGAQAGGLAAVGRDYAQAWRRSFAPRVFTAAAVAHWAMRPGVVAGTLPVLRGFPGLLSWGARLSGKARKVVSM